MKKFIDVAILIVNWQRYQLTVQCLQSLAKINDNCLNPTVYVLDNGSTNNSQGRLNTFLKLYTFRHKFIVNRHNLGFAEGNNLLIKQALNKKHEYICLLNNDTRVEPNFLEELVKLAELKPNIGAVGGKIFYERGYELNTNKVSGKPTIWYAGGFLPQWQIYPDNRGNGEIDNGQYDNPELIDFITGCLFLIKSSVLRKVGLFDPRFYHSLEDVDLSKRITKAGYELWYCPSALIWHLVSASSGRDTNFVKYFGDRNAWLYTLKWLPLATKIKLIRQIGRSLTKGSYWEKKAAIDFLSGRFGIGSWPKSTDKS